MLSALAFLTVVGGSRTPDERTMRWLPAVGAGIGGVLAVVWIGATELWPPVLAAALVLVVDLGLTGMLHVDGLADTADGLLPHLDRDRRLAVMRAPDTGAFAVGAVGAVLLTRFAALATDLVEPLSLVAVWAASRALMAVVPAAVPYARSAGLASPFLAGASWWIGAWVLPVAVVAGVAQGAVGVAAIALGLAGGAGVVALARRRLGGFTGDVLGASGVVAETVALVVLAAR